MTTRFALLLLGALAVTYIGCNRKPTTPQEPLLWSVTKDGKTSHLFGTMHVGVDPGRLPPTVWDKVDAARVLAVETDLSRAAAMPVVRTDGTSLRDELGPVYWKKLEDTLGIGEAARLVTFKPMIPATILAMHGLPETEAMDGAIEQRARRGGKPIIFLETLESEFAVLEKWLDLRALKDMLDDIAAVTETSKHMLAAYVAGDERQILAVLDRERARWLAKGRSPAEYDEQMADLLYRRNASWLAAIEKLHAEGGGFIAVGAAHLCGPKSVVDLLAQRGYTVTRVTR